MKRKYGSVWTNLSLSAEAQKVYNETQPLDIWEIEGTTDGIDTVYTYDITGVLEEKGLTEDEVNQCLIAFGDEYADKV